MNGHLPRIALAICLLAAAPSWAQPVSQDDINLERGLIGTGNAALALPALQGLVTSNAGNPELWFLLGMAQRATGDEAAAATSFTRVSELAPDQPRALLELGTSLAALNRFDDAYDTFNRALILADDRIVRRNIRRALAALDRKRVLSISLSTSAQPDTNANSASGSKVVTIGGIPFVLSKPATSNRSLGLGVDAAARYAPYLTTTLRLVSDANFTGVNFFHTCCSDDTATLASGPGWFDGAYHVVTQAYLRRRYFDGLPYSEERGGRVEAGWENSDLSLSAATEAGSIKLLGPHVPGSVARGQLGGQVAVSSGLTVGAILRVERDDYPIPSQSFTAGSGEVRLMFTGPFELPMQVWGVALERQFQGATLTSPGPRLDHLWGGGWMVDLDFLNVWGMSPQIGVTYISQASNDTLGRFHRVTGIVGLSKGL